jgi:SpoVK/Ycf46/Vps4 family AAA+-type ATPase
MILDGRLDHNHTEPKPRTMERQKIRQACKRKAEDETSERPSKLIIKEIEKVGVAELVTQDIKSVCQAMARC